MSSFQDYVAGKTIALVGPAPAPYDQSDEVEAHDIVYRCSPFSRANPVPGYGTRTDIGIYNGTNTRRAVAGDELILQGIRRLEWAVFKVYPFPEHMGKTRQALWPRPRGSFNPNQVTLALFDLTQFHPASVTVFGADFFTGPMGAIYDPAYLPLHLDVPDVSVPMRHHDQTRQRQVVRRIREQMGWPVGDERYQAALDMPDDEFDAIQERNWGVVRPLEQVYPHLNLSTV